MKKLSALLSAKSGEAAKRYSRHGFDQPGRLPNPSHPRVAGPESPLVALRQFTRKLTRQPAFEQALHIILRGMQEMAGASAGWIALHPDQDAPLVWYANGEHTLLTASQIEATLEAEVYQQALRSRQIVYIADSTTRQLDEEAALVPGRSLLIIPLKTRVGLSGVLTLAHPDAEAFFAHQEAIFAIAADVAATTLQDAWRHKLLQEKETRREQVTNLMVHDIRSPLMSTSATFEVIQRVIDEYDIEPKIRDFLNDSLTSGKRALQTVIELTNDLLDVKKLQSGKLPLDYQPVLIELLFDEVYSLLYSMAVKQQVIIRYQVRPRALKIVADPRLLRRALINLASNALRFSPSGSSLTLSARADSSPETASSSMVTLDAQPSADGKEVTFIVEDMGPGVPTEERERIFEPFAQGNGESKRGTGLGLAFCREVALAHGGHIWVEDRPGGGSRFCVRIPTDPRWRDSASAAN